MSDYERYGDYNEIEEDTPKSKNPILVTLRILTAVICIGVVGLIAFRLIAFNSYPKIAKDLYVNEAFSEYYESKGGDVTVKTQKLRAPYDDPDLGNFFCDYLYVIEDMGQLQITVRYNKATVKRIADELAITLDDKSKDIFKFRLCASYGEGRELVYYENLSISEFDSSLMYRYNKLVFDGVDFALEDGSHPYWIRLEVTVDEKLIPENTDEKIKNKIYMIPVYENNENFSKFSEYELPKNKIEELEN